MKIHSAKERFKLMDNLLMFSYIDDAWQVFDITNNTGAHIAGDPAFSLDPGEFSIFARGIDGRLLQFFYAGDGPWRVFPVDVWPKRPPDIPPGARVISLAGIRGDPVIKSQGRFRMLMVAKPEGLAFFLTSLSMK